MRKPETLRRWMTAYAAATATTASYEKIRDGATAGEADKPNRRTVAATGRSWNDCGSWIPCPVGFRRAAISCV